MKFTFLSVHKVQGIVQKPEAPDVTIYENPTSGLRATLTGDLNRHLQVINRQLALASMLLQGMVGDPLREDFHQNLSDQIETIRTQRLEAAGSSGVLVIEIQGEVEASIPSNARVIDDYQLCFDAFDKKALRLRLQPQISAVLTALRIGGSERYEFKSIADGSYLSTGDGSVVHSLSFEGGTPSVYISSPLTQAQIERIAQDIDLILASEKLSRVIRLHTQSLSQSTDNFRSFIAAWSALEILIGKIFPVYQKMLSSELRKVSAAPGLHAYLDRIANVMEGKYSLADKFSVISVFLDDEGKPQEIEAFRDIKNIRDRLSHGEDIPEGSLPTKDVQQFFEKYFRNHVRRDT